MPSVLARCPRRRRPRSAAHRSPWRVPAASRRGCSARSPALPPHTRLRPAGPGTGPGPPECCGGGPAARCGLPAGLRSEVGSRPVRDHSRCGTTAGPVRPPHPADPTRSAPGRLHRPVPGARCAMRGPRCRQPPPAARRSTGGPRTGAPGATAPRADLPVPVPVRAGRALRRSGRRRQRQPVTRRPEPRAPAREPARTGRGGAGHGRGRRRDGIRRAGYGAERVRGAQLSPGQVRVDSRGRVLRGAAPPGRGFRRGTRAGSRGSGGGGAAEGGCCPRGRQGCPAEAGPAAARGRRREGAVGPTSRVLRKV